MTQSSYPKTKIIEGWFQHASDYEYGPTLIRYIGPPSVPIRSARTACENLNDLKWKEEWIVPEYYGSKAWRAKITIEVFEEKELLKKRDWYGK